MTLHGGRHHPGDERRGCQIEALLRAEAEIVPAMPGSMIFVGYSILSRR
jgi:hypothetical protein